MQTYTALCDKNDQIYTSCYCEENVWKLLENLLKTQDREDLYSVFISNEIKKVPIWYQSKSDDIESPVVWDYHVIAVHKDQSCKKSYVYDFDSILNFPEPFDSYCQKCFQQIPDLPKKYQRMYRVIPAKYYLETFSSDRSHMINSKTGKYLSKPPNYPCIRPEKNNINDFISMDKNIKHGLVLNQQEFINFFI